MPPTKAPAESLIMMRSFSMSTVIPAGPVRVKENEFGAEGPLRTIAARAPLGTAWTAMCQVPLLSA